jgi:AcrR family transcriptional regulator
MATMDPRLARSRVALADAVFALASEQRIETVRISEVARRAGISRSTLYNHGRSPSELLEHLLDTELTALREQFAASIAPRSSEAGFEEGVAGVVSHVVVHLPVYEIALSDPPSSRIHHLLSTHLSATLADFLHAVPDQVAVPEGFDRAEHLSATIDAISAYAAHGAVGIIEAWFRSPAPRDPAFLVATISSVTEQWFRSHDTASKAHRPVRLTKESA